MSLQQSPTCFKNCLMHRSVENSWGRWYQSLVRMAKWQSGKARWDVRPLQGRLPLHNPEGHPCHLLTPILPSVQHGACTMNELLFACRNVRRDCMRTIDQMEKKGDLTEDDQKLLSDAVQDLTDEHIKQIDTLIKSKQDELSKV